MSNNFNTKYQDDDMVSCSKEKATRAHIVEHVFGTFCQALIEASKEGFEFSDNILDYPSKHLSFYQIALRRPKPSTKAIDKIVEQVEESTKSSRGRPKKDQT